MSTSNPTVIILAGGGNSRFFPFNTDTHKGAIELCGQTLIELTVRDLQEHGYSDIVLVVSPKDFAGQGLSLMCKDWNVKTILQPEAKGMGDAVLCAKEYIQDRFVVTFPYLVDSGKVLEKMLGEAGTGSALAVAKTDEPWLYGILTIEDEKVSGIVEKPEKGQEKSNLYATGEYLLSNAFLEILSNEQPAEYSFESALDVYFKDHAVMASIVDAPPSEKYPWHLFDFQQIFFNQLQSSHHPEATIASTAVIDESHGPVVIENGAVIGDFVKILGPAYIGRKAFVGDYSFVRQSSLEEGVSVGANTEVVRSILMVGSELHFGYLADSIVGKNVKIGAGILTANKRHDRRNIQVDVKGQKVDVGRNNLGVMIGNDAKIGVRTTIMPGVVIGADAVVWPGLTLYRNVERSAEVKE